MMAQYDETTSPVAFVLLTNYNLQTGISYFIGRIIYY
jgi:hypothetical protein